MPNEQLISAGPKLIGRLHGPKEKERRGSQDFRGDPECQHRDGEVIDYRM